MPKHIKSPTQIKSAGTKFKLIEEFIGKVNSDTSEISIAKMNSPAGWEEPEQTPEFDEYTFVLRGSMQVKTQNKTYNIAKQKNIITKAIGTNFQIDPSIGRIPYQKDDIFLLCTDGLTDYIINSDIKKIIENSKDCKTICENLINKAKNNGSSDNITALAVKIIDL